MQKLKKIILHVGSGKAGSTSIQQALFHGRSKNNLSYTYPVIPHSPGNQIIRYAFCGEHSVPQNIRNKYGNDECGDPQIYRESIKSSFREQCEHANTVIVSSEFLFHSSEDEVLRLGMFLRQMGFYEIHVLMYLRDPAKYYISSAQQALKKRHNIPLPTTFRYDMLGAIDRWSKIMPTSITIREFDKLTLLSGDVVKDFAQYLLGLDVKANLHIENAFNESMTSEVTQAIQDCYNYLGSTLVDDKLRLEKKKMITKLIRFGAVGGTKPKLKSQLEKCIHMRFAEEMRNLYSRFGIFGRAISGFVWSEGEDFNNECQKITLFRELVAEFDEDLYVKIRHELLDL